MIWEKKAQWSLTSMNELLNQCSFNSSEVHAQVMPVSKTNFQIQTAWKVLHSANCGEGNGNPLQYSCLENPRDRGAWQAAVHGIVRVGHNLVSKPPPLITLLHVCVCAYAYVYYHLVFMTLSVTMCISILTTYRKIIFENFKTNNLAIPNWLY